MNLLTDERFNHQCEVVSGVLEEECGTLLTSFFRELRKKKSNKKIREEYWELTYLHFIKKQVILIMPLMKATEYWF